MSSLPYMPLYVADYLADAAHLTTAGHGAYMLMLMTYWQTGKPLPDDDRKLARIVRMTEPEWAEVAADVREFFEVRDGSLFQKRVERELVHAQAKIQQKRDAGKASAERRANERSTDVQRDANDKIREDEDKKEKNSPAPAARVTVSGFDAFYEAYPKHVDRKATEKKYAGVVRSGIEPPRLLAAARAFAAVCRAKQTEPQYIKSPLVWLNKGCWDDDLGSTSSASVLPFAQPPPQKTDDELRAIARQIDAQMAAEKAERSQNVGS